MKGTIVSGLAVAALAIAYLSPHVDAALLYTNETDSTDAHTFIIDFDEDATDPITLSFGNQTGSGKLI